MNGVFRKLASSIGLETRGKFWSAHNIPKDTKISSKTYKTYSLLLLGSINLSAPLLPFHLSFPAI
jgi:hypothetical protein